MVAPRRATVSVFPSAVMATFRVTKGRSLVMIFPFSFDCPFDFAQGMAQDRPFVQCDSNRVILSQPVGCGPAPGTSRRVCRRSASVSTNRFCATEVATTSCRSGATGIKWPAYTIPRGVSFVCDFGLTSCGACTLCRNHHCCATIAAQAPLLRYRRCRSGALRHAQDKQ